MKPVKFHKHLFDAVIDTCIEIFSSTIYADKAIARVLKKNPRWGSRDRAFIAQHTYELVRWYRLLAYLVEAQPTPTRADWWHMLGTWRLMHNLEIPAWNEFKNLNTNKLKQQLKKAEAIPEIIHSIPDWLHHLGLEELGEKWLQELPALNEQAPLYLRVNTLKVQPTTLIKKLSEEGIDASLIKHMPAALLVSKRSNVFATQSFKNGLFEVQDIASQRVAPFMELATGMKVIDACAGAGGKTLHMAALMQNKGKIVAMDTEQWKLDELRKRAVRAGVDSVETHLLDAQEIQMQKKYNEFADRVLLDVPCSGLGVLRRNPDAKWKLNMDFINNMRATQQAILTQYSNMTKVGGKLIYATCSIMPGENENQIATFLQNNPNFELEEQLHTLPSSGEDGFFMARMKRLYQCDL